MKIYRDYGAVAGKSPPNNQFDYINHTQVWYATHGSEGSLLPSLQRSFISFSFGGKNIEEFNLIAVNSSDRLERNGSSGFQDLVTSYDIMDGQYYHGTHFSPFEISFTLATDGIDEKELQNFLHWFRGGMTRELILAEHPNRAIMARVSSPPELSVLPFEKPIEVKIGENAYKTSTTLYKGTINLSFVADTSFWYAKDNLFLISDETGELTTSLGLFSDEKARRDILKVVYEDNIPTADLVSATMHFGCNKYAEINNNLPYTLIAGAVNSSNPTTQPNGWDASTLGYFMQVTKQVTIGSNTSWVPVDQDETIPSGTATRNEYWHGARIEKNSTIIGRIAGPHIETEGTNVSGNISTSGDKTQFQFFYGGTAPSPVKLSFKINLVPVGNTRYINCIANQYYMNNNLPYSAIKIGSVHEKEFRFTTPNIIASYNKVIRMMTVDVVKHTRYTNREDILDALKDEIRHPAVRKWAVELFQYVYDYKKSDNTYFSGEDVVITKQDNAPNTSICINYYLNLLPRFFQQTSGSWSFAEFDFDSEIGTATGTFSYWICASNKNLAYAVLNNQTVESTDKQFITKSEDVGDMLCSNWLILEDHNEFTSEGYVSTWKKSSPRNAHYVIHNCLASLEEVQVRYKNMYL